MNGWHNHKMGLVMERSSMAEKADGELLSLLLELGMTVARLARKAMVGSLDPDGFALQELDQMAVSFALISRTRVLLNEVEIPPRWRELIVNLLATVEDIQPVGE